MKLTSKSEYEKAMREFSELESRPLDGAEAERKEELEAAIAAYSAQVDQPARRKGRPEGRDGND